MTDAPPADTEPEASTAPEKQRTFLCVVDESDELTQALRFACRRATNTGGRLALLYVIEPAEFQHWLGVGKRMAEEGREEAEEMMRVVSQVVQKRTGQMPMLHIREGRAEEELVDLIEEQTDISLLVLGASTGPDGPGRLVQYMVTKMAGKLRVPITIVPGGLSDEEIDAIS
jgi:nucleotide-binding universal stress UspA family protein